ncbi:MAG: translation elongation factor Ts [Candidatus Sungbacteria bacterium]|nr:translation elongation factor Ts [Candidatus Sungbacteria bacterium]
MTITVEQIKELRSLTGAGVVDVKKALAETGGDIQKAVAWLREKGKASAAKKGSRKTSEGVIGTYVHSNSKLAVLVALACETDFVARTDKFQELARAIALHIAAADPLVIKPEEVPDAEVENEKAIALKQFAGQKKPPEIMAKIVEGKLKKYREERALLTQPFVKNPDMNVGDLIKESIAELGENITVNDFKRLSL